MPLPNPPKGHRWRKLPYKDVFGTPCLAAYVEGRWWQGKLMERRPNFAYLAVSDEDTEAVWSLKKTPTEPVAPLLPDDRSAVHRESGVPPVTLMVGRASRPRRTSCSW